MANQKELDIKELMARFDAGELKKLCMAEDVGALAACAKARGKELTGAEAEAVFAALYPLRGRDELSDDDLDAITGGGMPVATIYVPTVHTVAQL